MKYFEYIYKSKQNKPSGFMRKVEIIINFVTLFTFLWNGPWKLYNIFFEQD